jgi:hypothetical protein
LKGTGDQSLDIKDPQEKQESLDVNKKTFNKTPSKEEIEKSLHHPIKVSSTFLGSKSAPKRQAVDKKDKKKLTKKFSFN